MASRSKISSAARAEVAAQTGRFCKRCGDTENLVIDHKVPLARGGTNDAENLQLLCSNCNGKKGPKLEGEMEPPLFGEGELHELASLPVRDAYAIWNEFAVKNKWQVAKVLDSGRRIALRRAVKDYGGLVGFRANLEKITRSDFCMGRVPPKGEHRQFQASLDWFIRPVTVRKVIEDFYNGGEAQAAPSILKQSDPSDTWARWLRDYKPRGFWPSHLGPRPEEPGCRAPKPMVDACLQRLGIAVHKPVSETREQRLTTSIATYRRLGNYERANKFEEELAALENRPPVLVPAPEVAHLGMEPKPAVAPRQPIVSDVDYEMIPEGDPDAYGE